MFGLSKKEKDQKTIQQFHKEFNAIMLRANASTTLTYQGREAGYDNAMCTADTLHNVYADFGYPQELSFNYYFQMYDRFGPASAVVDIPVNLSWMSLPKVVASDKFLKEFEKLVKKVHFWKRVKGWDNYQRVGRYAGMYQQVKDGKNPNEPVDRLLGVESLLNLIPIYEGQLKVLEFEDDIKSPNFDKPKMYQYCTSGYNKAGDANNNAAAYDIHPSRIEIAAEGSYDGTLNGKSALRNVYNDLQDLQKISGAGGEGFYQNSRNAPIINVPDANNAPTGDAKTELKAELDDFMAKFQKKFITQGMEFTFPDISLDNPKEFADNSKGNIAAGCNIATAIIFGQQMGVRASDKDFDLLLLVVQGRRENYCDEIAKNEIDWLIDHGVLPNEPYELEWENLNEATQEEKVALAESMMGVNEKAMRGQVGAVFGEDEAREAAGFEPKKIPTESEGDLSDLKDE